MLFFCHSYYFLSWLLSFLKTGNTCTDEGYANYPFPVGFIAYNEGTTTTCPLPITGDGSEAPERVSHSGINVLFSCADS
jgi:hypothetical protein